MKKKLLVVCGGQSSEHSISRISCNSVMKHLDKDKYEITLVGIAKDGQKRMVWIRKQLWILEFTV